MEDAYVDARKHLSVRPRLEYVIPQCGDLLCKCILGDVSSERVLETLPGLKIPERVDREEFNESQKKLHDQCLRVVAQMRTHLTSLLQAWKIHVTNLIKHSKQCVDRTNIKLSIATKNHTSLTSILDNLDTSLQTLRSIPAPVIDRPTKEINAFKENVSKSCLSTRRVEQVRLQFEYDLEKMQVPLATEFVAFVRATLKA